ncbi:pyridoxamine 5'-phosphate oxidase [Cupriavidus oxalaticus]|jgi:pyridoxamine 5'-phosphate oxidase|uniref:Pyridoxine/pyridoxamine 5'-phosphate oxidase n=1 Tax=Cupriavidus oxalaticus TaxID=96344 RepID=A0A375G222_9BURK|nr:pyridoxamine 5'-phosphate oxidase [Cupriavidus oxalaticus]QEZ47448.1 pyridoxamine 5'-phosphate oxidase [Cupriavidus oxalaticus]QRQ88249.1 pyridoxamine 5'-phosphate oxidase [Cupriavidus oxalaticus]QRQ93424.1 pyridoxamine 5'-phosphate oxidase [Cupriavidus oxalaticus]WQD82046.1 pyridoxamine 5'-phosphate oxidase [Cupriavidus oxalaticus]SPC13630.1 Pyridoxine/pyridoxamine 5'-phosphate oxidase [Cupriavidus oxalaticus]
MTQLADLRRTYVLGSLSETDVAPDPMSQFKRWFDEAVTAKLPEPNAMTLATVGADGQPSARIVLLKGIDDRGFTFFTNYESRKGLDLAANPRAALLFHWVQLERQVRVEGIVEKVADDESDAYFASRPLGSRVGAWASEQSREVPGRDVLEQRELEYRSKFGDNPPRPPHWGGYRLVPTAMEFWQGRPSRLHDRIVFRVQPGGAWQIVRLSP